MKTGPIAAVFLELGGILIEPEHTPNGQLAGGTPIPGAEELLLKLAARPLKLGVISDTGDADPVRVRRLLDALPVPDSLKEELIILSGEVGLDRASPALFRVAASRAGLAGHAGQCLFVGANPDERRAARAAGFRTASSLELALKKAAGEPGTAGVPGMAGLRACIEDARDAGMDGTPGPLEPRDYHGLLTRLEAARQRMPAVYREEVGDPFLAELRRIGKAGFQRILSGDPGRAGEAGLMLDIAQAILQNGEGFESLATDAFEEVVSDLYDGFLSAEDRAGIRPADKTVLAPLVKWGNPDFGPYTWPIDATSSFKVAAAVVNLPPANARHGLFAWTALGHETAGHDILHADDGLEQEFSEAVLAAVNAAGLGGGLGPYWSERMDESASDVMGILNMGPAAGLGLIVYFRGLNAAFGGQPGLRNDGPAEDPHPADILRGFLAAATVRLLSFDGAAAWADLIEEETMRDVTRIRILDGVVTLAKAKRSCDIVAETLATRRMAALNRHALIDIQDWRNRDEEVVGELRKAMQANQAPSADRASGVYAAHVVAAAAVTALAGELPLATAFQRMLGMLKRMHDANPSWGPLFIRHPGDIHRDFTYGPGRRLDARRILSTTRGKSVAT